MVVLAQALAVGEEVADSDREGRVYLEALPQAMPGVFEVANPHVRRVARLAMDVAVLIAPNQRLGIREGELWVCRRS